MYVYKLSIVAVVCRKWRYVRGITASILAFTLAATCCNDALAAEVRLVAPMKVDRQLVRSPIELTVRGTYHERALNQMIQQRDSFDDPLRTFLDIFAAIQDGDAKALVGRFRRSGKAMSQEEIAANIAKTTAMLNQMSSLAVRLQIEFGNEAVFVVDAIESRSTKKRSIPFSIARMPGRSDWYVPVGVARSDVSSLIARAASLGFDSPGIARVAPGGMRIGLPTATEDVPAVFQLQSALSAKSSPTRDRVTSAYRAVSEAVREQRSAPDLSKYFTDRSWRRVERNVETGSASSIAAAIEVAIGVKPLFFMEGPDGHVVVLAEQAGDPGAENRLPGLVSAVLLPGTPLMAPKFANVLYQDSFLRLVQSGAFRSKVEAVLYPNSADPDGAQDTAQNHASARAR